jgi:hypothetical protein
MSKRPLKQTTLNAFFSPKVDHPDDDDDVIVQSTSKRGHAIIISDSEGEEEAPLHHSSKKTRANRLVVLDTDDEEDDEPAVAPAQEADSQESLDSSDEEGLEEEEEDEVDVVGTTEAGGTIKTYAKGDNIWKRVVADAAGQVTRVEFALQPRPTPVETKLVGVFEQTRTLYKSALRGKVDIMFHPWQLESAQELSNLTNDIEDGCTSFFKEMLRLIDAGKEIDIQQATFWRTWANRIGWIGIHLRNRTQARRAILNASIKVAEANGWLRAVV